jgi:hypothetical protein
MVDSAAGRAFAVGERVLVTGGYDADAEWLTEASGYFGMLRELTPNWAVVELEDQLALRSSTTGWPDFGSGSPKAIGHVTEARGRWLALANGYVGQQWAEPLGRVHVGLCPERPVLANVPTGGGVGVWVESHATMRHAPDESRQRPTSFVARTRARFRRTTP